MANDLIRQQIEARGTPEAIHATGPAITPSRVTRTSERNSTYTPAYDEFADPNVGRAENIGNLAVTAAATAVLGPVGLILGATNTWLNHDQRKKRIKAEQGRLEDVARDVKLSADQITNLTNDISEDDIANNPDMKHDQQKLNLYAAQLDRAERMMLRGDPAGQTLYDQIQGKIEAVIENNAAYQHKLADHDFQMRENDRQILRGRAFGLRDDYNAIYQQYTDVMDIVNESMKLPGEEGHDVARAQLVNFLQASPLGEKSELAQFMQSMGPAMFAAGPLAGVLGTTAGAAAGTAGGEDTMAKLPVSVLMNMAKLKIQNAEQFVYGQPNENGERVGGEMNKYIELGQKTHGLTPEDIFDEEDYTLDGIRAEIPELTLMGPNQLAAREAKLNSTSLEFAEEFAAMNEYLTTASPTAPGVIPLSDVMPIINSDKLSYGIQGVLSDLGTDASLPQVKEYIERIDKQFGIDNVRIEPVGELPTGDGTIKQVISGRNVK